MTAMDSMRMAIACGGTGGHLFPGLAVAEHLCARGCRVTLLISSKDVDQQGVQGVVGMEILTLPAVALNRGGEFAFLRGFLRSYRCAQRAFRGDPPAGSLAMGGFTSAPPVLAAWRLGSLGFLHESNSVPGRANRWLSWMVDTAFIGFPSAAGRLHNKQVVVSGTPVRSQFQPREARACRLELGLDPDRPVVLVMGGSQGATAINALVTRALPVLAGESRRWQWFHLAGQDQVERVRGAYAEAKLDAVVHPFFSRMEIALGAASVAVSRAGASSMAELAAQRLPAVLVPYPTAADNHQWHNARAFELAGAARLIDQSAATPERLVSSLQDLGADGTARDAMRAALARWDSPGAAKRIADMIFEGCANRSAPRAGRPVPNTRSIDSTRQEKTTRCPMTVS